jgi:hypothetical protein
MTGRTSPTNTVVVVRLSPAAPSLQTIRCKEMAQTMKKQDCLCLRWKALTPDRLALQIAENYLS